MNCRALGRCTYGELIDREVLDMVPREGPDDGTVDQRLARPRVPLGTDLGKAFLYARYNVDLSSAGLERLGFRDVSSDTARKMDKADREHIELLLKIGAAAAKQVDVKQHFGSFAP
jgi:hypothetical protein